MSALGFKPSAWGHGWNTGLATTSWLSQMQGEQSSVQTFASANGIPMVAIIVLPMADTQFTATSATTCWSKITSGAWDSLFVSMLNVFAGQNPIYVRPGIEMNLTGQFQWQLTNNAASAAGFKASFQRIYQLAHNQIAGQTHVNGNVVVSWCPSAAFKGTSGYRGQFLDYFPGGTFVDAIGCDIYGSPLGNSTECLRTPDGVDITLTDCINLCKQYGKPLMLGEWGSGNDTVFATNVANLVHNSGVAVSHVVVWDMKFTTQDLLWTAYPGAATTWKNGVQIIAPTKRTT